MFVCAKHPKFVIRDGVYFKAANIKVPSAWVPKNDVQRETHYRIAVGGDMAKIAALMAEAKMIHANESSPESGYVSVARCPACLSESTDPLIRKVLRASKMIMCQLRMERRNEPGAPYVFHVSGEETAGTGTEALVLLPTGMSLMQFHERFAIQTYVDSFKGR